MSEAVASFRRIEAPVSLRETVSRALTAAIVSGDLAPGTLVSVPSLTARFAVSATPVREAMLDLEKRGFVTAVRNKGFRVTEVSPEMLSHIAEVRQLLEPPAMEKLAGRFPQGALPALREQADAIVTGARSGDLVTYLEADRDFHLRLTTLAGNPLLVDVVADLRSRARLLGLSQMVATDHLEQSAAEHHELLDLLAAGDAAGARDLMRRHIGHTTGWWAGRPEDD
ncbi:GntR family transcriptional regulator [Isoptericola sp. NPDC056618]|uniref:GntR family transcriptional regulator n=1 Tax=unclassified Isoptericola TaxID=2623355 RepID=UPI0036561D82